MSLAEAAPDGPVLGVFDGTHDAGAALVVGGRLVAAASEERFTRVKGQGGWPAASIAACLDEAGVSGAELTQVAFSGLVNPNPGLRLARPLQERWHLDDADAWNPTGVRGRMVEALQLRSPFPKLQSGGRVMRTLSPVVRRALRAQLRRSLPGTRAGITLHDHHACHAGAAWHTAGWDEGLVLVADGVGDGLALSAWRGKGQGLERILAWPFPHSHGLLYATITAMLGYRPFRHEGKLAGLAAHGDPDAVPLAWPFQGPVRDRELVPGLGQPLRQKLAPLSRCEPEDVCAWLQRGLEADLVGLLAALHVDTGLGKIALAGGVFANVSLNRAVARLPGIEAVWVFPHMGDGGLAAGAALLGAPPRAPVAMQHAFLGAAVGDPTAALGGLGEGARVRHPDGLEALADATAEIIAGGGIVAVCRGRAEYGPRALGHRSILASAADPNMNARLNRALRRSDHMPFAPAMLAEDAAADLDFVRPITQAARFMTVTAGARPGLVVDCPAVVHVDGTLRPQLVHAESTPFLHAVLVALRRRTGRGVALNTSFNVHEEPIVQTLEDAVQAWNQAGLDALVLGDALVERVPSPQRS